MRHECRAFIRAVPYKEKYNVWLWAFQRALGLRKWHTSAYAKKEKALP